MLLLLTICFFAQFRKTKLRFQNKTPFIFMGLEYGATGRIRTSDRSVRSRVLYPAELRMQVLKWR